MSAKEAGMEGYGKRVLVVDDDHHARFLMASILARQGYNVVPASDGLAALTELSKRNFDLVITDDRMPSLNGMEFLKQVQARHPRIPVILTATEIQEHTFTHDCRPFASAPKPYDEAGLLTVLQLAARATNAAEGSIVRVQ
jgi:DNA-binding NtrC family response regulator